MNQFSLLFHMKCEKTTFLLEGRLILLKNGHYIDTFVVTSGVSGFQARENQDDIAKGLMPCSVDTLTPYQVSTNPSSMPNKQGIRGNFYPISPYLVKIWEKRRGDFGIHFDADYPGSAGCIVARTRKGWEAFEQHMKEIKSLKIAHVPLVVSYS